MAPKRSDIWFHFKEISGKDSAKCLYCGQILSTKNGSMGNLSRHMKLKHVTTPIRRTGETVVCHTEPVELPQLKNDSESANTNCGLNISSAGPSFNQDEVTEKKNVLFPSPPKRKIEIQSNIKHFAISKKPLSVAKNKEIDKQLLQWIVKGYHSFRVVEELDFQNLCEKLCPNYKLPCRKTLSASLLDQSYDLVRDKIKKENRPSFCVCNN